MRDTDTTANPQAKLRPLQLTVLVAALLAGILAAQLFAPGVYRASPTDLNRNGYLLDVLSSAEHRPAQVVLGNSVTMQGVDTRILTENLIGEPLVYNLATTGQGLTEANIFFSALPPSVETVIHVFYVYQLQIVTAINEQKYNALFMYGYRMPEPLKQELIRIYAFETEETLNRSMMQQAFDSRWAPRQAIDTLVRDALRTDLELDTIRTELYFPSPKSERLPPEKMQKVLIDTFGSQDQPSFLTYYQPKEHLDSFIKQVKDSGRNYVMVIAPLNPAAAAYVAPNRNEVATEVLTEITQANDVLLINAMDLLTEQDFADALHPTVEGAGILSRYIAEQLNQHPELAGLTPDSKARQ
jgi:hypothetical protein